MLRNSLRSAVAVAVALVSCGLLGLRFGQRVGPTRVSDEFRENLRTFTPVWGVRRFDKICVDMLTPVRRAA